MAAWSTSARAPPDGSAALDAAECPPTYGVAPDRVVAIVAGGNLAESAAVEGAEDDAAAGAATTSRRSASAPKDVVVGISASGRTPYVLARARGGPRRWGGHGRDRQQPGQPGWPRVAEVAVELLTGPEVLAGSTRLKAGSAQKVALNVISTGAMVAAGRTYGAWMVDVVAANEKLRRRARRILREATGRRRRHRPGCPRGRRLAHEDRVGRAAGRSADADVARERLERHGGRVRRALEPGP